MTTSTIAREEPRTAGARPGFRERTWIHLLWFAGGVVLGFAIPYIFTSLLDLQHDWYLLVYFAGTLTFLSAYARVMRINVPDLFLRSWKPSAAIGLPVGVFLVLGVLSRDSTDGPEGLYAVFEVVWRGFAYGVVDALLLTAFPGAVAFAVLRGNIAGIGRRLLFPLVMIPLVFIITGVYHLGYEQFRDDGIGGPEFGNAVISVPMLATANPIGSVMAHASMHVAADIHVYETDLYLPPQTEAPE
jgi:hypothetical protein